MIRLLTARTRIRLVVAAMAVAVPMITFAQTTEPAIESVPASDQPAAPNSSPKGDENSTDKDTSVQTEQPVTVEVEIQRRINELRSELLDDRASYIDRWLSVITIVLTFFGIVAVVGGYIGFRRFREIETEAKNSVETVTKHAEVAKRHIEKIERNLDRSDEILRGMTAENAADYPEKANQAVESVRENPEASLIDKAIANAVFLQQQGKRDDAIEKWRAIAHIAEGSDNDLAARAWFSIGYLAWVESSDCILAHDEAIRLKPDYAEAYNNRGVVKDVLGRYDDALADYDEAIRLKPDHARPYYNRGSVKAKLGRYDDALVDYDEAIRLKPDYAGAFYNRGIAEAKLGRYDDALADYDEEIRLKPDHAGAYNNRGVAKDVLGRYDDALADYDEAIRLKPDLAEAYGNRGNAKNALGLRDEARKDFETALELARNANNAGLVAKAEQSLRDLDDAESS